LASQSSVLSSFAKTATVICDLRTFVSDVFQKASQSYTASRSGFLGGKHKRRIARTVEAFADAIDHEIQSFDMWCASREEAICRACSGIGDEIVVSLLSLEKTIRDTFSETFEVLLEILHTLLKHTVRTQIPDVVQEWTFPEQPRIPPGQIASFLLDTLIQCIDIHLSMDDHTTSSSLTRVFATTVEPMWAMVRSWLGDGMPVDATAGFGEERLDQEFFIEDGEMGLLESEFWEEGYVLRGDDEKDEMMVPTFLSRVAGFVLASGKTVGLLRALGVPPKSDGDGEVWLNNWQTFEALLSSDTLGEQTNGVFRVSTDTLSQLVYDVLLPYGQKIGEVLIRVLVDDCEVEYHLGAIENLFLMRRGDTMSHFADVLFGKVSAALVMIQVLQLIGVG
jgi:gamma-tubulin complex component 5